MALREAPTLTPDVAAEIVIARCEGLSYRQIVDKLRAEGYRINPQSITRWIQQKREVELYGDVRRFDEMMYEAELVRVDQAAAEMVEIADGAIAQGTDPRYIGHQINARVHAAKLRSIGTTWQAEAAGRAVTLIVPESERFGDDVE